MRTVKISATEIVKHELVIDLDDKAFKRIIEKAKEHRYQDIADVYLDDQTAVDSEFEEHDVDISIKDSDGEFVPLWTLKEFKDAE